VIKQATTAKGREIKYTQRRKRRRRREEEEEDDDTYVKYSV
jgi:hypothetical protein